MSSVYIVVGFALEQKFRALSRSFRDLKNKSGVVSKNFLNSTD
jgi:hypothetical protein